MKLTTEQDTILLHKAQNPDIYGKEVSNMAQEVLWRAYQKHAKYAIVKCGLRGILLNNEGIASSSPCEDAESEAVVSMMNTILHDYKITCGFKLITIIDRRARFRLIDCIRDGKFVPQGRTQGTADNQVSERTSRNEP